MRFCIGFIIVMLMIGIANASDQRVSVNVSTANIRAGPGENHKILWKIEKYHPFERIRTSGVWYYVRDYEGDKGWIHKDVVGASGSVIVIKDDCLVRIKPDPEADIAFTVEKGVSFKVLERRKNWIHVEHADGEKGWIYKKLVW